MEVKCKVCGTINDSKNPFCKGCFIPLHRTMEEYTKDIEDKVNENLKNIEVIDDKTTVLSPIDQITEDKLDETSNISSINDTISLDDIRNTNAEITEAVTIPKEEEVMPPVKESVYQKPIGMETMEINDLKQQLSDLNIVSEQTVELPKVEEPKVEVPKEHEFKELKIKNYTKEKNAISLTITFEIILIACSLIFSYFYGFVINDNSNILFGALSTILFSAIATFITFRSVVPKESEINKTLLLIFIITILFEGIFRSYQLYKSEIFYLYYYIFIIVLYVLVDIMIINTISKFVRKNKNESEPSKYVQSVNFIVLIIVVLLAVLGLITKNNNIQIQGTSNTDIAISVPEELYTYIDLINAKILENIQNDENYEMPTNITETDFIESDIQIDALSLNIDEFGTVSSGQISYDGHTYHYSNQQFKAQN